MAFPFLTVFIIFVIFLAFRYRRITKKQDSYLTDFWEREARANATVGADIHNLPYITIPLDKFPFNFSDDPEITVIEDELTRLSYKKFLNLSRMSNTEVKEKYGANNFDEMAEIGENYEQLEILLCDYAKALIEKDRLGDAKTVLEFAVSTKTDMATAYTLLADCYRKLGNEDKIPALAEQVKALSLLNEQAILESLGV